MPCLVERWNGGTVEQLPRKPATTVYVHQGEVKPCIPTRETFAHLPVTLHNEAAAAELRVFQQTLLSPG